MPRVKIRTSGWFAFGAIARGPESPLESLAGMGVIFGKKVIKNGGHFVGFQAGNRLD
jgi:hypothetical protein